MHSFTPGIAETKRRGAQPVCQCDWPRAVPCAALSPVLVTSPPGQSSAVLAAFCRLFTLGV
jgi:hypothetical protein